MGKPARIQLGLPGCALSKHLALGRKAWGACCAACACDCSAERCFEAHECVLLWSTKCREIFQFGWTRCGGWRHGFPSPGRAIELSPRRLDQQEMRYSSGCPSRLPQAELGRSSSMARGRFFQHSPATKFVFLWLHVFAAGPGFCKLRWQVADQFGGSAAWASGSPRADADDAFPF